MTTRKGGNMTGAPAAAPAMTYDRNPEAETDSSILSPGPGPAKPAHSTRERAIVLQARKRRKGLR